MKPKLDWSAAVARFSPEGVSPSEPKSRCMRVPFLALVRVLERRKRAVEARVRVLEGPWESRIVWVPIDWVR